MKKGKAPGIDNITRDIIKLGGKEVKKALKTIFNETRKPRNTGDMERGQNDYITQKGERRDIKNYTPVSRLSHTYKLFTRAIQNRMEKVLDENQPREQAGFRKKILHSRPFTGP